MKDYIYSVNHRKNNKIRIFLELLSYYNIHILIIRLTWLYNSYLSQKELSSFDSAYTLFKLCSQAIYGFAMIFGYAYIKYFDLLTTGCVYFFLMLTSISYIYFLFYFYNYHSFYKFLNLNFDRCVQIFVLYCPSFFSICCNFINLLQISNAKLSKNEKKMWMIKRFVCIQIIVNVLNLYYSYITFFHNILFIFYILILWYFIQFNIQTKALFLKLIYIFTIIFFYIPCMTESTLYKINEN